MAKSTNVEMIVEVRGGWKKKGWTAGNQGELLDKVQEGLRKAEARIRPGHFVVVVRRAKAIDRKEWGIRKHGCKQKRLS